MLISLAAGFSTVTAVSLTLFGLYATVKTKGLAFRSFPAMLRQIRSPQKTGRTVSPFRAFATSLSGTIGVGNLTGVAVAISLGGPGAVFWMWISALLCMTVKYFEIYLAIRHQPKEETHYAFAPMEYVKKATESKGFAGLFALFGVFSALLMGNMIQTNAAVNTARTVFSLPGMATGLCFAGGAAFFLWGGIRRITEGLEKILPLLGGGFLLLGLIVIGIRADRIPSALVEIFRSAFSFSSAGGGLLGSGIALAFRHGVGNGLFSHEAGLGSAGLAHGACGADPEKQGLWGIFEVFFDTVVISTISALMILTTRTPGQEGDVTSAAEAVLGKFGAGAVALCLILFAFLSVLSWSCYGETCFVWICGKKTAPIFRILYLFATVPAIFTTQGILWQWAEVVNGGMMILNLTALFGFRKDLVQCKPPEHKRRAR